ncbi:MAG: CoA pyrophosphatase [Anaerolineae bacterium]|nr:CoA pyrophosphatase [Anaerolineae bacterium]
MMITLDHLTRSLHLPEFDPIAAQLRMSPPGRGMRPADGSARQAGVLVLIYAEADGLHVILTRRTEHLGKHSGQISFPGGRRDPHDASLTATALRETCEELGICDEPVQVIGALTPLYIPPSNYEVFPTVATLPARPLMTPNPEEVAEVFSLPLDHLLDARIKMQEDWDFHGVRVPIPFYAVQGHKVWGATAVMLSELEQRLRAVLPPEMQPLR